MSENIFPFVVFDFGVYRYRILYTYAIAVDRHCTYGVAVGLHCTYGVVVDHGIVWIA